jgi:hypothetical protein
MAPNKHKYKLVCGVGINDSDSVIYKLNGRKIVSCVYYQRWNNMIGRCYSDKIQATRRNYIGCKVDERWHRFSCFRDWMSRQMWQGRDLDKDLIGDGILYSPETCLFITHETNCFISTSRVNNGGCPPGVRLFRNGKFQSYIREKGRLRHLGYFETKEQAHKEWRTAKAKQAIKLADAELCERVADGLRKYASRIIASDEKTEIILEVVK